MQISTSAFTWSVSGCGRSDLSNCSVLKVTTFFQCVFDVHNNALYWGNWSPGMGGGWCWPDAWTKDRRKEPKQCTLFRVSAKTALFTCSVLWKTVPFHCLAILTALKKMNDFACLRPEKPTIFYKMYFPSLNHDSTAHCPALEKIPFLIAFLFKHRHQVG